MPEPRQVEIKNRIEHIQRRLGEILSAQERALLVCELSELEHKLRSIRARAEKPLTKGSVEFLPDGRARVFLSNKADVSTVLHEFAHVMRRHLGKTDLQVLENWLGVEGSRWERVHEEKFARGWERFWWDGDFATSGKKDFSSLVQAMRKVYPTVIGSPINVELPAEVRQLFGRWISMQNPSAETTGGVDHDLAGAPPKVSEVATSHTDHSSTVKRPLAWAPPAACTFAVGLGLLSLPYGAYILLRAVICFTAVLGWAQAFRKHQDLWLWTYGAVAILYNPLLPVHLGKKDIWIVLNIVTVIVLWVGTFRTNAPSMRMRGHDLK